jgi:hypothetical protein
MVADLFHRWVDRCRQVVSGIDVADKFENVIVVTV